MSAETGLRPSEERIAAMVRQYEVERFYYDEAAICSTRIDTTSGSGCSRRTPITLCRFGARG